MYVGAYTEDEGGTSLTLPGCDGLCLLISGRTCIMANIIVRALQEQARRAASEAPERKQNFVCAWVIHEPWQTEFDWVHCLASQVRFSCFQAREKIWKLMH
jgi:hypothetical protein